MESLKTSVYYLKRVQTGIDGSFEQTTSDRCHRGRSVLLQAEHEPRGTERRVLDRLITNSYGSSLFSFEYHCGNFKNDHNRIYMSYRASLRFCSVGKNEKMELVYRCRVYNLIETLSMDDEGNMLKKTDSTCIFWHDVLSLLQGEVSFKMSVIVKSNGDLFSEALPDELGEDEVLLLQTVTCQREGMRVYDINPYLLELS